MICQLVLPDQFHQTAMAYPSKVKDAIAQLETAEEAGEALAKADAVANFAKRINATAEEVNHVQYGKLLLAAKLGELCPAEKGGRGKKGIRSLEGHFYPVSHLRRMPDDFANSEEFRSGHFGKRG